MKREKLIIQIDLSKDLKLERAIKKAAKKDNRTITNWVIHTINKILGIKK